MADTKKPTPGEVSKSYSRYNIGGLSNVKKGRKEDEEAAERKRQYESVGTVEDVDRRNKEREKIYDAREAAFRKQLEEKERKKKEEEEGTESAKPIPNAKSNLKKLSPPSKPKKSEESEESEKDLW